MPGAMIREECFYRAAVQDDNCSPAGHDCAPVVLHLNRAGKDDEENAIFSLSEQTSKRVHELEVKKLLLSRRFKESQVQTKSSCAFSLEVINSPGNQTRALLA